MFTEQEVYDMLMVLFTCVFINVLPEHGWALRNGVWALGADSYSDLVRKAAAYTLDGVAHLVTAPTLVLDAEQDQFFRGQPQRVAKELVNAETTLVTLTDEQGAGEHCHMGAMSLAHQTMFDWLDTTLGV